MRRRNVKERREIVDDSQDGGKVRYGDMELVAKCRSPVHVLTLSDCGGEDQFPKDDQLLTGNFSKVREVGFDEGQGRVGKKKGDGHSYYGFGGTRL